MRARVADEDWVLMISATPMMPLRPREVSQMRGLGSK